MSQAKSPKTGTTKDQILEAGRKLFGKQGYKGTSMTDIALAVGIKKASIYYFFKNKQEIYLLIIQQILTEVIAQYSIDPSVNPTKILTEVLGKTIEIGVKNGASIQSADSIDFDPKLPIVLKTNRLALKMNATIEQFLKRGGVKKPAIAKFILIDAIQGYVKRGVSQRNIISRGEFVSFLTDSLLKK